MNTLVLDSRDARLHSMTVFSKAVGFYFAFRLVAVVISVRLFGAEPQAGVVASLGLNYILLVMAAFLSFGPGARTISWFCSIASLRWAVAFLLFSGFSLFWTVSTSFSAATAFWCAMASDFTIVILLLRIGCIDETADSAMKGYIWGACAIGLVAWVLPSQSDLRLGDEDYLGPNQIGYACAFAFFLAQYLMRKGHHLKLPAGLLAVTLLRSLSKTTIIAFLAAQFLLLIRDRSIPKRTKVLLSGVSTAVILGFWRLLTSYYDVYTHAGNQSETLTGRIGIWAYILNEALQQPWIGHGFHSVWKVIPPFGPFEARHAHNELLQQFYAYGLAGVALTSAVYGSAYIEIRRMTSGPIRTLLLAFFLFILVRGLADTEVFDLSLPLWAIALMGSVIADERRGSQREMRVPNSWGPCENGETSR
jgi:exopolysaccharide production protein ExoQ